MCGRCLVVRSKMRGALARLLINPQPIPAPFLDLAEVAAAGIERIVVCSSDPSFIAPRYA
jgi:hypothetical protein